MWMDVVAGLIWFAIFASLIWSAVDWVRRFRW
jgi:hypothetical protein